MRPLPFLAALAVSAGPALADLTAMTDAERAAFRDEVRAYLLEDPEVLMEAIGALEARQAAAQSETDAALVRENAEALFGDDGSWVGGNPDGDVTVVEFLDYRCGFCRQAHPEVEELVRTDGNVRLVLKEFPILGEASVVAARYALATRSAFGDEAYKRLHDGLYALRAEVTPEALDQLALSLDLDPDAIRAGLADPAIEATIAGTYGLAQRLGISGTPTFVIADRLVRGYVPLDALRDAVTEARAEAD